MSTPTEVETTAQPKKQKLSWKEKLALLPEDEAKELRAKAAEASRRSKAKSRGTTPEQSAILRLESRLARVDTQLAELKALKTELTDELKTVKATLTAAVKAAEKAQAQAAKEKAQATDEAIGMTEAGDLDGFPTEEEYNA